MSRATRAFTLFATLVSSPIARAGDDPVAADQLRRAAERGLAGRRQLHFPIPLPQRAMLPVLLFSASSLLFQKKRMEWIRAKRVPGQAEERDGDSRPSPEHGSSF